MLQHRQYDMQINIRISTKVNIKCGFENLLDISLQECLASLLYCLVFFFLLSLNAFQKFGEFI